MGHPLNPKQWRPLDQRELASKRMAAADMLADARQGGVSREHRDRVAGKRSLRPIIDGRIDLGISAWNTTKEDQSSTTFENTLTMKHGAGQRAYLWGRFGQAFRYRLNYHDTTRIMCVMQIPAGTWEDLSNNVDRPIVEFGLSKEKWDPATLTWANQPADSDIKISTNNIGDFNTGSGTTQLDMTFSGTDSATVKGGCVLSWISMAHDDRYYGVRIRWKGQFGRAACVVNCPSVEFILLLGTSF